MTADTQCIRGRFFGTVAGPGPRPAWTQTQCSDAVCVGQIHTAATANALACAGLAAERVFPHHVTVRDRLPCWGHDLGQPDAISSQ